MSKTLKQGFKLEKILLTFKLILIEPLFLVPIILITCWIFDLLNPSFIFIEKIYFLLSDIIIITINILWLVYCKRKYKELKVCYKIS